MLRNFQNLIGSSLSASDGEIGSVREIYFDDETWKVRYFVVQTGSWMTGREVLIAPHVIQGFDEPNHSIAVNLTMEEVRQAPPVETDMPVSRRYERQIHSYYGWDPYWDFSGLGVGVPVSPGFNAGDIPLEIAEVPEEQTNLRSRGELDGDRIHASDQDLGKVEDLIIDDQGWSVRYLAVRLGHWLTLTHVLLSTEWVKRVSFASSDITVDIPGARIMGAPPYYPEKPISREYETVLHRHFGFTGYWAPWEKTNKPSAFKIREAGEPDLPGNL